MERKHKAVGVLAILIVFFLAFMLVKPGTMPDGPKDETSSSTSEETQAAEFTVSETVKQSDPEDALVQVDDLIFQLGYCEKLSDAIADIESSGRYTTDYDAGTSAREAKISVYRDENLLFTLVASSIKEYESDSKTPYASSLFAPDLEENMAVSGIDVTDYGMTNAWIFSGYRLDGSNVKKEEFMTRFGSYASTQGEYPSLIQLTDSSTMAKSAYELNVEVNAPDKEILSQPVLTSAKSLRTLSYTFIFGGQDSKCLSIKMETHINTNEITKYWDLRNDEKKRQTGTVTTGAATSTAGNESTAGTGTGSGTASETTPGSGAEEGTSTDQSELSELEEDMDSDVQEAEDGA